MLRETRPDSIRAGKRFSNKAMRRLSWLAPWQPNV
jgi:hypothetical protein